MTLTDILLIALIGLTLALHYQAHRIIQFLDAIGEMIQDYKDGNK